MNLIKYTPTKGTIEIRTLQGGRMAKIGSIKKQRGTFKYFITRTADLTELTAISGYVTELNGARR